MEPSRSPPKRWRLVTASLLATPFGGLPGGATAQSTEAIVAAERLGLLRPEEIEAWKAPRALSNTARHESGMTISHGQALEFSRLAAQLLNAIHHAVPTDETATNLPTSLKEPSQPTIKGQVPADRVFVHVASSDNITENWTAIDHPWTNGNPEAIVLVTPSWRPRGVHKGTYNAHPIGVWFEPNRQRWAIFNQDRAPMPEGVVFNVELAL